MNQMLGYRKTSEVALVAPHARAAGTRPMFPKLAAGAAEGDASKALAMIEEIGKVQADFHAAYDKQLEELRKGVDDPVTREKVERLNTEVGRLQAAIDKMAIDIGQSQIPAGDALTADEQAASDAFRMCLLGVHDQIPDFDPRAMTQNQRNYAPAFRSYLRRGTDEGLRGRDERAEMTTQQDDHGGYFTPAEMTAGIERLLRDMGAMRRIARRLTTGNNAVTFMQSPGEAGAGWVNEKDKRPETDTPRVTRLTIPIFEMYAQPAATQTLLDDAGIPIEGWLTQEVGYAFAGLEEKAFIEGDGVDAPRGLLSYPIVKNANWVWEKVGYIASGDANTLPADKNGADALIDLQYSMDQRLRPGAVWLMNQATQATIRKMKDDNGQYYWQPSMQLGQPASLFGHSILTDDYMPDVAAGKYPIAFISPICYTVIDRMGVRVLRDPYTAKPNILFYSTRRVGGGMRRFDAAKIMKIAAA